LIFIGLPQGGRGQFYLNSNGALCEVSFMLQVSGYDHEGEKLGFDAPDKFHLDLG
jgi:hypothetical protein